MAKQYILVEIKAATNRPAEIEAILNDHNADFKGIDHQIDTYFKVNHGRLKLREGNIENHLIQYHRPNQAQPKTSKVLLYKSNPETNLKAILTNALGVLVVVDKKRKIFFIDNVKFHIDEVNSLGAFVEVEAIGVEGTDLEEELRRQCNTYLKILGIKSDELVTHSYSDMMLNL